MARVRIDLDSEEYGRLLDSALAERRPVPWHAGVLLRRALGLPFPAERPADDEPRQREGEADGRAN